MFRSIRKRAFIGRQSLFCAAALTAGLVLSGIAPASAQDKKPNILFIMGDDIGWMQPSIYHRGLMVGETPNIDRIGAEGAMFTDYYAEQSCTAGRNADSSISNSSDWKRGSLSHLKIRLAFIA